MPITQVTINLDFYVYYRVINIGPVSVTESWEILAEHYNQDNQLINSYPGSSTDTIESGQFRFTGYYISQLVDLGNIEVGDYFIFKTINACLEEAEWRVDVVMD